MRKVTRAQKRNAWADRDELLHSCRGPRRNHLCRFVLRSPGFGRGGGSNFGFLHWLASSPLQHSRTVRVCDTWPTRFGAELTWLNSHVVILAELQRIELKSQETKFWRHQVDKPATYLSTIEAIYYCAREYHELTSAAGQYCQQYDDLLFFFVYFYRKIQMVTAQRGRTLKAYSQRRARWPKHFELLLCHIILSVNISNSVYNSLPLFCVNYNYSLLLFYHLLHKNCIQHHITVANIMISCVE